MYLRFIEFYNSKYLFCVSVLQGRYLQQLLSFSEYGGEVFRFYLSIAWLWRTNPLFCPLLFLISLLVYLEINLKRRD